MTQISSFYYLNRLQTNKHSSFFEMKFVLKLFVITVILLLQPDLDRFK